MKNYAAILIIMSVIILFTACDDEDGDTSIYNTLTPVGDYVYDVMGVSTHLPKSTEDSWELSFSIDTLSEMGTRVLRDDFKWRYYEPNDDEFTTERYDNIIELSNEAGIKYIMLLKNTDEGWAYPDGTTDSMDPDEYAEFAAYIANTYPDEIKAIEILNEINMTRFWTPEPNPEKYGEVLKASYTAVKDVNPDIPVIFSGLSVLDEFDVTASGIWIFLKNVYEYHDDICNYMDGFTIHPYMYLQMGPPEVPTGNWPTYRGYIDLARQYLDDIGCGDKDIWITEYGWHHYFNGLENQAAYLVRGALLSFQEQVKACIWYTFLDGSGNSDMPTEDTFGLYTYPDGESSEIKLSGQAYQVMFENIGSMQYAADIAELSGWSEDDGNFALAFTDSQTNSWVVAAWNLTDDINTYSLVSIPLPGNYNNISVVDIYGNEITDYVISDSSISLAVGMYVRYIRFSV